MSWITIEVALVYVWYVNESFGYISLLNWKYRRGLVCLGVYWDRCALHPAAPL